VTAPRAVGVRLPYAEVPRAVRDWVEAELGSPVVSWDEQVGGMSPGCATRLVADDRVTGWLVAFGVHLAWRSTQGRADVGLPTLNEFRRTEACRFLGAAARRLG